MGAPKGRAKAGGRAKGTPNKVTADARAAIASFVDGNAHRLQEWLDQVARGVQQQVIRDGQPVTRADGTPLMEFVVDPNPEKAFSLFQSVIEYHVPKLARNEVSATVTTTEMSPEERRRRIAEYNAKLVADNRK